MKVTIQLDGLEELRFFNDTPDAYEFGSGLTLSEWSTQLTRSLSSAEISPSCKSILSAYSKALQLGTPQLRNVARIGGSLFYIHPCSGNSFSYRKPENLDNQLTEYYIIRSHSSSHGLRCIHRSPG